MLVRNFANFQPPMAYTVIKDRKQVEYNFVTLIRARARCAVPMSLEFHTVEWLHAPIKPDTGTLQDFTDWDEPGILRVLSNAVQRLGGRRKGSTLAELQHRIIRDTSRMYNPRTEPQPYTAMILSNTTCWADPQMVDRMTHQNYQTLKAMIPKVAKEPNRKTLPISDQVPNNPKMAMEIFMILIAKQEEEGNSVYASYLTAVETYKEVFARYGHQDLADQLPESRPAGSTSGQAARHEEVSAGGSTTSVVSTTSPASTTQAATATRTDVLISDANQTTQMTHSTTIAHFDDTTMPRNNPEDRPASISHTQAAHIELELNELPSLDQQDLPLSDVLAASLNEVLQDQDHAMDHDGHD